MANDTRLNLEHRRAQLLVKAQLYEDIKAAWPTLDVSRIDETRGDFTRLMYQLTNARRAESAELSAEYLREHRALFDIIDELRIEGAPPLDFAEFEERLASTSSVSLKVSARNGVDLAEAIAMALRNTAGLLGSLALDGGRETVRYTGIADPRTRGYRLLTDAKPCPWCAMQASRDVLFSQHTKDRGLRLHPSCGCSLVPLYTGVDTQAQPERNARYAEIWGEAKKAGSGKTAVREFQKLYRAQM